MSAAGWLDMNAALQSLNSTPEPNTRPATRPKRRSSYAGRSATTAGIHGRGSIGSVSAGLYKAFRERFLSSDDSGDYRKLRQRDAEVGRTASSSTDSSGEDGEPSSSSSVEDLFANEADRRKWQRKTSEQRRRAARKKMGNRTGSSASCEDLILEISLPDETMDAEKMSLSLQENDVDLGTCLYRLRLPLPHPVDVDRCQAKYDSELRKLRLTLRLKRELDYVNF